MEERKRIKAQKKEKDRLKSEANQLIRKKKREPLVTDPTPSKPNSASSAKNEKEMWLNKMKSTIRGNSEKEVLKSSL